MRKTEVFLLFWQAICWTRCCYILLRVGQSHWHIEHRLADSASVSQLLTSHVYTFQEFTEIEKTASEEGLRGTPPQGS
jgi:hypothetical protein